MRRSRPRVLAACYRAPYLALAIAEGRDLLAVERVRVRRGRKSRTVREHISRLRQAYRANTVVLEPNFRRHAAAIAETRILLSLPDAKHRLTGNRDCTHHDLYRRLTHEFPALKRLVTGIHGGRVRTSEPWKTILLLAAALSVAASTSTL